MHVRTMLLASAGALALAPQAFAQTAAAPATSDEIIVTAERREQSLQDVPVSVTAFTAEMRQTIGLENLEDFANFTPGLSFSASNDRVFIRGIGRQTNTNGSDPGVATYNDGVYDAATSSASRSDFFVDRVEILRGPQGTLYGRNSIGGAINTITKRPTEEFSGELRATVGNYELANIEAAVSGALAKGLRARLAGGHYEQNEGYFDNVAGGPSEGGVNNSNYAELQIEGDLSQNLDAWFKVFGGNADISPRSGSAGEALVGSYDYAPFPSGYITPGSAFGFLQPGFVQRGSATTNPGANDPRTFSTDTTARATLDDNFGLSTQITWRLPGADLKYTGGWQTYVYQSVADLDNTSVVSYAYPLNPIFNTCAFVPGCTAAQIRPSQEFGYVEDKSFGSSELTLSSNGDGALQWIVGAYYYADSLLQESHFRAPQQAQLKAPANGPANPSGDFVFAGSNIDTESYAFFGQADWRITDQFTLTGGLRYTNDKKSGVEQLRVICYGCVSTLSLGDLGSLVPGIDITSATASFLPAPGVASAVTIDPLTGIASRRLDASWDATTGVAGIQWTPDDDTLAFLRYSRGYKSGGFNAGGISLFPETDPESVDAVEFGVKHNFGQKLQVNASVFHYQYEGLQVPLTVLENGINITRFFNLDESTSTGFELETVWRPTNSLRVMLNYGYGTSEIKNACCFVDGADLLAQQPGAKPVGPLVGGQQPQSLNGQELPEIPRHKVGVNIAYDIDFAIGVLTLSGNYAWRDETYHGIFNRAYTLAPAYDQVDLRAVWKGADDRYRIIAYANNVFDELGYDNAQGTRVIAPAGVATTYSLTAPRTLGVQVQYRF